MNEYIFTIGSFRHNRTYKVRNWGDNVLFAAADVCEKLNTSHLNIITVTDSEGKAFPIAEQTEMHDQLAILVG